MRDRTLHLIDIENLARWPRPSRSRVLEIAHSYAELMPIDDLDHVVIACNHGAALDVGIAWPTPRRLLVRSGPNGADRALLDVIEHEGVDARFDRMVIGSGDGMFATAASQLAATGVEVTAVGPSSGMSRLLRMSTHRHLLLPGTNAMTGALGGVA
jgi:hypothetical protein